MTSAADWSGRVGDAWAAEWRRTDRSFAGLDPELHRAILAAAPDEGRAVDLGCGAGATSLAVARARPDLSVTGVDVSSELARIAAARAADRPNLRFVSGDLARDAARPVGGARLLFSRHGVMFFDDPVAVFTAVRAAAAPDARLVFSCFRDPALNPWSTDLVAATTGAAPPVRSGYAPGPFGFADADWTGAMLAAAGWTDIRHQAVDYSYVAGAGDDAVSDAAAFFRRIGPVSRALADAAPDHRPAMLGRLTVALVTHRRGSQVTFPAAAWIWSARA